MEYRSIYKCRLCGERYASGVTGNKELALRTVVELTAMGYSVEPQAPTMTEPHSCKGGGFGIADFQGWERTDCHEN